jgi:O-antigen/teichoic acid export membrane protein
VPDDPELIYYGERMCYVSMLARLRNHALSNIAIYGVSTGLAAVLTLVQTRVLWRALTPADFGVWALVDPLLLPLACLVLFGIDHSIVKQLQADRIPLRVVAGTLLISTLPATALCLLVIGLISQFVFHLDWTSALLLTVAGEALILMMQTAFRATGSVTQFAVLLLSRNVLYLGLLLLVQMANGSEPLSIGLVFLSRGVCVVLISLLAVAALRPTLSVNWAGYRDAVHYGFPLLLTTFIYGITDMTDRWFLAEFNGVVVVGLYSLHLKMAAIMAQAIVVPFGLWFPPERFRRLDDPDHGHRFFKRTAAALSVLCVYLSGGVWLARDIVLPLIAPGVLASPLVLACCLSAVTCLALSHALNVGLLMPGHTGKNAYCTGYAVAATVLASAILVPLFGIDGAAVSRLVGGFVLVSVTAVMSYRAMPIAFPFTRMLVYFAVSAIAAAIIDRASNSLDMLDVVVALVEWTVVTALIGTAIWVKLPTRSFIMPQAPPSVS